MTLSTQRGYRVLLLTDDDTTPAWTPDEIYVSRRMTEMMAEGLTEEGFEVGLLPILDDLSPLDKYDPREWLVFNWIEEFDGRPWPEAHIAEQLEKRGFTFTGASSEVLRFSQHRADVVRCLREAGLPVLPSRVLTEAQAVEWELYPAIVKGANQHASTGITSESIVDTPEQLAARIRWMKENLKDSSFVEPFMDTREFHVAIWGNANPEALPPTEMDYSMFEDRNDRLYSNAAKFDMHSRVYNEMKTPCPAPADDPALQARLEEIALRSYQVTGLRDYGRIDLRLSPDGPMVLDVNANPDLDSTSVHPIAAAVMGLTYGQMAAHIVESAAERFPR